MTTPKPKSPHNRPKRITDRQRIDWLSNKKTGTKSFTPQMSGGIVIWEWQWKNYAGGKLSKSLRFAIDSAINAQRNPIEEKGKTDE